MSYVHNKFCKNKERKSFAIGCSMGANILANILGRQGNDVFIQAACVVQAPIKKWESAKCIKENLFGIYDKALGEGINDVVMQHESVLKDMVKQKTGLDIKTVIKTQKPSVLGFDE